MKNKFIKNLSLGIACIMLSVSISAYVAPTNTLALTTISTNKTIIIPCQDPPYHR